MLWKGNYLVPDGQEEHNIRIVRKFRLIITIMASYREQLLRLSRSLIDSRTLFHIENIGIAMKEHYLMASARHSC